MKNISIYQIEDTPIGSGSIGRVFRGTDPQGCQVAIKEIFPEYATDFAVRTRTGHAIEQIQQLNSDNIVKVYDLFPLGDNYYIVMELVDGAFLNTGDIFPQVIRDYINSADLFVLFWSENASKSEYVDKERKQALERAFPQVKPQHEAKLSIYPMSIEPRAELPSDMRDNYHFGEI